MPDAVIVIGTYDGHVLAFSVHAERDAGRMLTPILGLKAHGGSIRSVCTSGRFAVSASTDETMSVFDLVKVVDLGQLYQSSAGVSTVAMHGGSHLISGSDGGRMAIFRSSDWEELTSMPAHSAGVVDLAIHPSGRLALSVGKDSQLYTWNLMRAKCVLKRPLAAPATAVQWSPSGAGCAVVSGDAVLVLDLASDGVAAKLEHAERVLAFAYLTETLLVSGGEDKALRLWDLSAEAAEGGRQLCAHEGAHSARIKALVRLGDGLVGSASSDGSLKLWRVRQPAGGAARPFEQVDGIELGVRITCLAANADGLPELKAAKARGEGRGAEGGMAGVRQPHADAQREPKAGKKARAGVQTPPAAAKAGKKARADAALSPAAVKAGKKARADAAPSPAAAEAGKKLRAGAADKVKAGSVAVAVVNMKKRRQPDVGN